MKKIILILISLTILVGCELGNTPTARVEDYLSKYQMLDKSISTSYTNLTADTNLNQSIKEDYEVSIEKQYRNLSYEVKNEEIDGDKAIVTVQIEVMDYKKTINKYNKNDYETEKYHELILEELEDTKEMVTYTIEFNLTKAKDGTWTVNTLKQEDRQKLLGIN